MTGEVKYKWRLADVNFAKDKGTVFSCFACGGGSSLGYKRDSFTIDYAIRLQNVQIECTDALRIIRSRDYTDAFIYCDPPYFNSDCGHYDGYSREDFEQLLKTLSDAKGKFLMSSYPSDILKDYTQSNGWSTKTLEQAVSVANGTGSPGKKKIEVLTANYDLSNPKDEGRLF